MSCNLTPAEVRALKREISSSLHCALPGIVESFDASGRRCAQGLGSLSCLRVTDEPGTRNQGKGNLTELMVL